MRQLAPVALLLVALAGCAGARHTMTYPAIDAISPDARDPADGRPLAASEVSRRLTTVRGVYVAEQHAVPAYHAVQRAVLDLLAAAGGELVIAVEWLPPSAAPALDAWLAGDAPVAALATALDWKTRWGHDFAAYAPLFRWARDHRVPFVPINAEPGLARAVARAPLAEIPAATRAQLPPLDTGNPPHRAFFDAMMRDAMAGHGGQSFSDTTLDHYYLAQLVWDETMSRNVARLLADPAHPRRTVVVLAGLGHIAHGFGVPLRTSALTGLPFAVVVPVPADELATHAPWTGPAPYPEREADVLWVVGSKR